MIRSLSHLSTPGIRTQLTLWYTLVAAGLILLFSMIFYSVLQQLLASSFDTTLQLQAQQVAEGVSLHNDVLVVDHLVDELPELDATAALVDSSHGSNRSSSGSDPNASAEAFVNKNIAIRILDRHLKVVYVTPLFSRMRVPGISVTDPLHGTPWRGTITGADSVPIRLYSTMLVEKQEIIGIVQIGQPLTRLNDTLQHVLQGLFIFTPFALALSALVSYWLAGRAFRPVQRLTRTAREISIKDLHRRVAVPLAHDEVRDLAIIFNQMIGRLEHSFEQQRRFVSDASHELRTPVTVIRSITDIALSQPDDAEESAAVLREVNAESERLGHLISDLLSLARADEGQVLFDFEPVRVDLLASDVVDSLEPLAVERQVTLRGGRLDEAQVLGDAARLIQVIITLVDNALAYTNADGEVTVSVETCPTHVHIIVLDTGIGISASDLPHIFERFYRADPARTSSGNGLGLSIADWLIRAHKGAITVQSQPGQGSMFTITLPRAQYSKIVSANFAS